MAFKMNQVSLMTKNKVIISGWIANILGWVSLSKGVFGLAILLHFIAIYCFGRALYEVFKNEN